MTRDESRNLDKKKRNNDSIQLWGLKIVKLVHYIMPGQTRILRIAVLRFSDRSYVLRRRDGSSSKRMTNLEITSRSRNSTHNLVVVRFGKRLVFHYFHWMVNRVSGWLANCFPSPPPSSNRTIVYIVFSNFLSSLIFFPPSFSFHFDGKKVTTTQLSTSRRDYPFNPLHSCLFLRKLPIK